MEVNTMEFPRSLFSDETRPDPKNFINYSSTFKTVKAVKDVVSAEVWEHVEKSPLGVIIKYVNLEFAWSSTLVHYILSRQLYCRKKHEIWFLIEKQPARFSLFEFEDITGLNCGPIPNAMVVEDVEKINSFWALFNLKRSRSTPSAEDICALCRLSPDVCKSWCKEDQIRLCYLAILTGGLLGLDRREPIPPAQAKLLMDLEIFEQYPWGRVAFVELVNQIKRKTESGDIKQGSYVCKGFVQVIQVWAYAYIPCLGEAIGRPISSSGLCLLRFKGSNGRLSLGKRLQNAKVTCMCPRIMNEVHPGWEHRDEDPEVDNLLEFLSQGNSLSTITWQALPEYPLTPMISNNKRSRVASQRKSKKSKKLASREQENAGDGGENSCDIAENEVLGKLAERVKAMETRVYSGPFSAILQSSSVTTMDNLEARVTQLEEFQQVIIPEHDRFSNTKPPAKPKEFFEVSIGETTGQGTGGPQVSEKKEEKTKDNKPVGEVYPQTVGHPQAENAGDNTISPRGFGALLENINQSCLLIDAEASKKQPLLTPKVEAASETNKEPADERAIELSSESNDLTYSHHFTPKEKTHLFETTSYADVTVIKASKSLELQVLERQKIKMFPQANNPPTRFQPSRTLVLAANLRSPYSCDDTQVKGVLNRYAPKLTLVQLKEVVYGPAKASDIEELTTFRENRVSIYPIGSEQSANEFFDVFLAPRQWLEDMHMDAALDFYRLRLGKMFPQSKMAIMDVFFQLNWATRYQEWKRDGNLPKGTRGYYHGQLPQYARAFKLWRAAVDTIFSCLHVNQNHWVAMVISIPDRTVTIYDSGRRTAGDVVLRKHAVPFAEMFPHALKNYAPVEEQPNMVLTPFKIVCVRNGVPRAKRPYGDCGVYALKFLECLMLGVDLDAKYLTDNRMDKVRENLAVEMYLATTKEGTPMYDPSIQQAIIDGLYD